MPRKTSIATIGLGLAAAVCGVAALYWWLGVERTAVYTDNGSIAASADSAAPRDVLWRPPESLVGVNSLLAEGTPRVSPGGDTIFFSRTAADGGSDLYESRRTGASWSDPVPIEVLNSPDNEVGAIASPDGQWIYFASDRPGGLGGYDLWRAPREGQGWGKPVVLDASVNSASNELHPAPARGGVLLFASDRARSSGDREVESGGFDIYKAGAHAETVSVLVTELSSDADDVGVAISPSEDFVYLSSDRSGGAGGFDLYRSRLSTDAYGPVEALGAPINTPANELEPGLAMEGFALLYASDAEGTKGATDLLRSVSREVYLARGSRFAGLLGDLLGLLPWILALLAIILLLAMLRRLHAGGSWEGRLSTLGLMARCVLASLILHALLLAFLAYWQVQLAPGSPLGDDEGSRVSLVSGGGAQSIGSQIRGGFTEADVTRAEAAEQAPESSTESVRAVELAQVDASADASLADRALAVQASGSDARVVESGASTSVRADVDMEQASVQPEIGAPRAASQAMTGEAAGGSGQERTLVTTLGSPLAVAEGDGRGRNAALDARASTFDGTNAMGIRVGADEAAGREGVAGAFSVETTVAPGGANVADLALPTGSGRAVTTESPASGSRRAMEQESGAGPLGGSAARSGIRSVTPESIAAASGQDTGVVFGSDASEAAPAEGLAFQPGLDVPAAIAREGLAEAIRVPEASGTETGLALKAVPNRGAERVAVGRSSDVQAIGMGSGTDEVTASLAPEGSGQTADMPIGFASNPPEARPIEDQLTGGGAPTIAAADAISTLASVALTVPGSADAGSALEAVLSRGVERAKSVGSEVSPDVTAAVGGAATEVAVPESLSIYEADVIAVATAARDATGVDDQPLGVPTALLPELGLDHLDTLELSPMSQDSPHTATGSMDDHHLPVDRLVADSASSPSATAAQRADTAEVSSSIDGVQDGEFSIEVAGRAAEVTGPASVPLGIPEMPVLVPTETVAIALPVPIAPLRLTGVVLDDETGMPIVGARVRLDLIETDGIELTTDGVGAFAMGLDDVPDNIALAAFADGYVPGAINIAEDDLADDGAFAEFRLVPFNPFEIAMESEPRVHHLGNDEFSGRINSQFQRESEGVEIRFEFELGESQLPPNIRRAEIVLLAKGVQLPNPVGVNGRRLSRTLAESPDDGSFGEQRIPIPLGFLSEGTNWIAFRSIRSPGTDIDDFEFVNVRVVFDPAGDESPL